MTDVRFLGGRVIRLSTPALEVQNLRKVYSRSRPVTAVDDVSFTVDPGEVLGLLGPNGAGKTTIIKCALGLVRPTAGRTLVFGRDVSRERAAVLTSSAAVLEGSRNVYWRLSAWENVSFFASLHGRWSGKTDDRRYCESLIERFGLTPYRDTQVRELSSGYKQKVAVVAALARRTPLVFLDEPTLGLDVETSLELRRLLGDLVAEEGRTVVISSHDMDVVQDTCQRVVIVSGGKLVAAQSVSDLLSMFRARRYQLEIPGQIPDEIRVALTELDPNLSLANDGRTTQLAIQLAAAGDLYRLTDQLRGASLVIECIVQNEPALEQAFLALVQKERQTT